jgi:predicted metal-dependent peptidase
LSPFPGGTTRLDLAKLAAGRVFVSSRYPYLASALFAAPMKAAVGSGTIAVDGGWCLHADPDVVDDLPAQELGRLIVHLLSHVLRDHAGRAGGAGVQADGVSPLRWNRATDAEINDDLAPGDMVPDCAPELPGSFDSAEGQLAEYYVGKVPPGPRPWDCGSGCDGVARPWDGDSGRDGIGSRDAEWLRLAVAAEMLRSESTEPGTVPAGWMRWAEHLLPSKIDWRRVLAAEIQAGLTRALGMVDYSYRRPSRRAEAAAPIVLPSLERPVPDVAIVCDTSGSMTADQLGRALAEVEALLTRVGRRDTHVRVLSCDAEVHTVRRVARASQIELVGGGGTDMAEGIAQAVALRPRPSIVVVLTDGWTPWPDEPPRGVRVVVGLIEAAGHSPSVGQAPPPPPWTRLVRIGDS